MIIRILDEPLQFLASALILVGLWNSVKSKNWWLIYFVGSLIYTILNLVHGDYGFTLFGCATLIMATKNYIYGRKFKKGFLSNKTQKTWQAQIYCGFRRGYTNTILPEYKINEICQKYVDKIGWCVTSTPTNFIYKNGHEPGVVIGIIQYPRFPNSEKELKSRTLEMAKLLLEKMNQERLTICFPDKTILVERENNVRT